MKKDPGDPINNDDDSDADNNDDFVSDPKEIAARLAQHRQSPAFLKRIKSLTTFNERIAKHLADPSQNGAAILLSYYESKLNLLETLLKEDFEKDFRVLSLYFPSYLDTLGKLMKLKTNPDQFEKDRLQTFNTILSILNARRSRLLIHLDVKHFFEQDKTAHFPALTVFGSEYSKHVSYWYYKAYTTRELLELFIENYTTGTEASNNECEFIYKVLADNRHEGEDSESYLKRQAAIAFIHLELSYRPEEIDHALENLSFAEENDYSLESLSRSLSLSFSPVSSPEKSSEELSEEESVLINLSSLNRLAQCTKELERFPSNQFLCMALESYYLLIAMKDENKQSTSNPWLGSAEQFALLQSFFEGTDMSSTSFRAAVDQYFSTSDDQVKDRLEKLIQKLSQKSTPTPVAPKPSQVSEITLGFTPKRRSTLDTLAPVQILGDATNLIPK